MKNDIPCLSVCQPYPTLMFLPVEDDRVKAVENRTWSTEYRGPLLIHAGKSREWLRGGSYGLSESDMTFGAILGIVLLIDCVWVRDIVRDRERAYRRYPWLATHQHFEGPCGWILVERRKFETPVPYRGMQKLFSVPLSVVEAEIEKLGVTVG